MENGYPRKTFVKIVKYNLRGTIALIRSKFFVINAFL
jgi:hypothetical protein